MSIVRFAAEVDEELAQREMAKLMSQYDTDSDEESEKNEDDSSVDSSVDDRDAEEAYQFDDDSDAEIEREVYAENNALDHIVLGCCNLDKAMDDFEELTGIRPEMVVSHNGLGTKSARISFDDCQFLELIGPDPKQSEMPLSMKLAALEPGKMVPFHYGVRNNNAIELKETEWVNLGYEPDHISMYGKDKKGLWKWDLVFMTGHELGGLVPFFIDWGNSKHACSRLPVVGKLESVEVTLPAGDPAHELLKGVKELDVFEGEPSLLFVFHSPLGRHSFQTDRPVGISFPDDSDGTLELRESSVRI